MLLKRIKWKASVNIITSLLYQFIGTTLGLILPYLLIGGLGSESNGLLSSVGQLFTCLGLLEAGIGSVSLQALYKPVATVDRSSISSILAASDKYYKKTGYLYAVGIIIIAVIYPYAVDSVLSPTTIRQVILYQGIGTLIGYFYYRKYLNLFRAEGKNYVINLIMICEVVFRNIGKIIALNKGYNVAVVQLVQLVSTCVEAIIIYSYVKCRYGWIEKRAVPNFKALSQKTSAMTQYISWMVFNHTDILVLTIFTRNLAVVSVYSVYLLIFEAVQNISNSFRESYQYILGRLAQQTRERLTSYYCRYASAISAITNSLFVIAYILCEPFISLYTHNVHDINYLMAGVPELFMIYKILYCTRAVNRQLIEVVGCFRETQSIPVLEAVINIVVSVCLVPFWGIYGVLVGTIIALLYSVYSHIKYIGIKILENQTYHLYILQAVYMLPIVLIIMIRRNLSIQITGFFSLVQIGIITALVVAMLYYLLFKIEEVVYKNIFRNGEKI